MPKLTSKRQVTVPQSVCEALGLMPGDYVEVFERDGVAHIVKMDNSSLAGKFAPLIKTKKIPSSETMKKAIKTRAANKFENSSDRG